MRPKSAGSLPNTADGAAAAATVPLSPSREHVAVLQARLLDAGLLQAVVSGTELWECILEKQASGNMTWRRGPMVKSSGGRCAQMEGVGRCRWGWR